MGGHDLGAAWLENSDLHVGVRCAAGGCFLGEQRDGGEDLALLLFASVDGQGEAGVNDGVEFGHIVIQVGLADLGIRCENVLD